MGGCRCTYFNCKKSSDSVTHFFHYPVKDEERCLAWLQRAQRLEFKSLTKTQLNNKVICQYHFEDNMFMNYRHDRLVPKAVPMDSSVKMETDLSGSQALSVLSEETDVKPTSKEVSTMSVNTSPITGLSFIAPHEKRPKNTSSYIELLTRQRSLSLKGQKVVSNIGNSVRKRSSGNQSVIGDSKDNMLIILDSTVNTTPSASGSAPLKSMDARSNVTLPMKGNIKHVVPLDIPKADIKSVDCLPSNNILVITEDKVTKTDVPQAVEISFIPPVTSSSSFKFNNNISDISPNQMIGDLFKTPPKSINNTIYSSVVEDLTHLRKRKHIFSNSEKDLSFSNTRLTKGKIKIVSDEPFVTKEQHIAELINKTFSSSAADTKTPTEAKSITSKTNIINRHLLLFNKQNEKKNTKNSSISRPSPEKKSPILVKSHVIGHQNIENSGRCFTENIVKSPSKNDNDVPINECIKLINKNSKEIAELKRMLLAQRVDKRVIANRKPRRISKSFLFTQIVPYLSPETAKMVHVEMFPFLARKKV